MINRENSPFTPGNPVPVELFVGRTEQIQEILRYVGQTISGKQENIFLSGERGIGKSSLASFIRQYVIRKQNMIGIHVFLGRVTTLEGIVRHVFDQILKETKNESWFSNIKNLFGKYIENVDLFGISVSFSPPNDQLKELVRNFPQALFNLLEKIKNTKSGILIILDDVNGVVENSEFANWFKSLVDEVATHYDKFPILFNLLGLPEKRDALSHLQPSLMRIFRVVDIEKLSDEEVGDFFEKAFSKACMIIKPEAMKILIQYSSGLPILMHEIGDAVFWTVNNNEITQNHALQGISVAANNIGKKYLDPLVYRAIRSERYRSILRKIGQMPTIFRKKDVEIKLTESEKKVFHNFLQRIKDLGVISSDIESGPGVYRFVNEIYRLYISMESIRYSLEKTKKS